MGSNPALNWMDASNKTSYYIEKQKKKAAK
jgi:hypothetical protein